MKRPAFQFYPADWRKDPALSACSLSARGLWIELMCIAHESEDYGVLSINGNPMSDAQLARMVGEAPKVLAKLLSELGQAGVFSRNDKGAIYSRRMIKDERIRRVRAEAGKLGGNPDLIGNKDKQHADILLKQNGQQNLTPSSSSSTTVNSPPVSPLTGGTKNPRRQKGESKTFRQWIDACKATGVKPVTDHKSLWGYSEAVGLPAEFVELLWLRFKQRYTEDAKAKNKRYIDWHGVLLNAVKGRWFQLWYFSEGDQAFRLTTEGQQAEREFREAA